MQLSKVEKEHGHDHPGTLGASAALAESLIEVGRYKRAGTLIRRLLEVCQTKYGDDHVDTIGAMDLLARILFYQESYGEAETILCRVLDYRQTNLGEKDPATITTKGNLALVYNHQGQTDKADELDSFAVQSDRRIELLFELDDLMTKGQSAISSYLQGRRKEAEDLALEIEESRADILGCEQSTSLIDSLRLLGVLD